jgi:hypothetical protein
MMTDEKIMLAAHRELCLLRKEAKSMQRAIKRIGDLVPGLRALLPVRDLMLLAEEARRLGDDLDHRAGDDAGRDKEAFRAPIDDYLVPAACTREHSSVLAEHKHGHSRRAVAA